MEFQNQKELKDKMNETLYCSSNENSDIVNEMDLPGDSSTSQNDGDQGKKSLENIITKCQTVLKMGENAKQKSKDIEAQFLDLKQKIDSNSKYLDDMKKNVRKLNFFYQKKALELSNMVPSSCLETDFNYTKEDMAEKIEETRKRIDDVRHIVDKQENKGRNYNSYREALKQVFHHLEDIDNGVYNETDNSE